MSAHKSVFECQKALLPVVGGASIGTLDGLCLTPGRTLFELIDDEGEEERSALSPARGLAQGASRRSWPSAPATMGLAKDVPLAMSPCCKGRVTYCKPGAQRLTQGPKFE